MPATVRVYIKKQLRLENLSLMQREMWALGNVGLESVIKRVSSARDSNDAPAAPLKSVSWKRIKMSRGLRPIRDLRGTGMMMPQKYKGKKRLRKMQLKNVGHLLDQIKVTRVANNIAVIGEPTTVAGRIKARAHRAMLLFSPKDRETIRQAAQRILNGIKNKLIKFIGTGQAA